jgi:hypothetical protein
VPRRESKKRRGVQPEWAGAGPWERVPAFGTRTSRRPWHRVLATRRWCQPSPSKSYRNFDNELISRQHGADTSEPCRSRDTELRDVPTSGRSPTVEPCRRLCTTKSDNAVFEAFTLLSSVTPNKPTAQALDPSRPGQLFHFGETSMKTSTSYPPEPGFRGTDKSRGAVR